MPEQYTWEAIYRDGSVFAECPDPSDPAKDNTFANVEHERLIGIRLTPNRDGLPSVAVSVPGHEGARGIFLRRRPLIVPGTEPGEMPWFGTAVGFQKTVNGKNVQALAFIGEDGHVVLTDRDIADLDQPIREDAE